MAVFEVRRVRADVILPLRTRVLRPHFAAGELAKFEGDDADSTRHFALYSEGQVVGCATFMTNPSPTAPDMPALQLRGMATESSVQGSGVGTELMRVAMSELAVDFPDHPLLWCNARERALRFYERLGFAPWGAFFDVPTIGPHIVMWRELPRESPA